MDEVVGHVDHGWRIPEELWVQIQPLLPLARPRPKGGRTPVPHRQCLDGIFYVLRILPRKDQWKALPRCLGAASTIHDRFHQWRAAGVFDRLLTEDHGIPIAVASAAADRLAPNTQGKGQKWLTSAQSGVAR